MFFNEKQQEIIDSVEGAFLVSAPVGTGKTTVLTERVVKALDSGIKASEILCLTFTNRAAEEMFDRIKDKVGKKEIFDQLTIKTFHGFCAYFIKAESKEIGISPDFVIFEEEEQVELMKGILEKYPEYIINKEYEKREIIKIIEDAYKYRLSLLMEEIGCKVCEVKADEILKKISLEYSEEMDEQNALDFNELVLLTIRTLYLNKKLQKKWWSRYKFIQLDEFQDTHLSEYLVVKELAKKHKNVSFIGDLDQTIYSWRGSEPFFIKKLLKVHFPKLKEMYLETNYRFNPAVLFAVKSFLESFENANTKKLESLKKVQGDGKCIDVFAGYNFSEEINWVIENIKAIREKEKNAKIVVLVRANYLITKAAQIFSKKGVAHITVDKYEFFRRQEVKDIYAYLKLIFNKFDLESAYRLVKRPPRSIGPKTIKTIREKGNPIGLKVSDFLSFRNYNYPEPFYNLQNKWDKGRVVVLDTETTGINTLSDEIIQIFAIEVVNGKRGKEFYYFLKNTILVGASENIHGISDNFLREKGRDPKEILKSLKEFIGADPVIGHNVNFDLSMILENGKRHGINFKFDDYYDTLDISRRLVEAPNYRLNTLAEMFGLEAATHDARDDVIATVGLLEVLIGKLKKNSLKRVELFTEFKNKFISISAMINGWQEMVKVERPKDALLKVWIESGLKEYYEKDIDKDKRLKSIEDLKNIFEKKDDKDKRADIVLRELIHYASLARDINFLGLEEGRVPIVTAHQAKGLEFDYVFIIGVNEYGFPVYKGDLEEEKRLFYVAMTRAKKKIFISYSKFKDNDMPMNRSPFIGLIDSKYINFIS